MINAGNASRQRRFILQRINKDVFHDPAAVMDNVCRVAAHLHSKAAEPRNCLSLVRALDDNFYCVDERGDYWRMYRFLEGLQSYDSVPSKVHARHTAREFGRFMAQLRDLPGPRLHETIPDFHNTPARYARLHEACEADTHDRSKHCGREIEQALKYEDSAGLLVALKASGDIPERVVHNDTKINNVMFDADRAVCVVDLDTVMPGLAPYDFGDMVRSATMTAAEDETDLSRVAMRFDYYEALVEGFLTATGGFLTEAEVDSLAVSGRIITIEAGIRFLIDYLCGDRYFRTQRPGQNLDRCRAQFALAASIDAQLDDMQKLTAAALGRKP